MCGLTVGGEVGWAEKGKVGKTETTIRTVIIIIIKPLSGGGLLGGDAPRNDNTFFKHADP